MKRNKKIDCMKLIASCFVVFIHVVFPGKMGIVVRSIARFAVPLFFCISGYYTYGLTAHAIKKRIIYIIKLQIFASGLFLLWGLWKSVVLYNSLPLQYLKDVFCIKTVGLYIVDQINPFSGHLWYLSAIMVCYMILFVYVVIATDSDGNTKYKYLYFIAFSFLSVMIFICNYIYIDSNYTIHHKTFRNGLYIGFPFVVLGLFVKQYKDVLLTRLKWNLKKGNLIICGGVVASIIQEFALGKTELPMGMFVVVPSIMLILISDDVADPPISNTFSKMLSDISLTVYIVHVLIHSILTEYNKGSCELIQKLFTHPYLYPCFIVVCSISLGVFYSLIKLMIRKKFRKTSNMSTLK